MELALIILAAGVTAANMIAANLIVNSIDGYRTELNDRMDQMMVDLVEIDQRHKSELDDMAEEWTRELQQRLDNLDIRVEAHIVS